MTAAGRADSDTDPAADVAHRPAPAEPRSGRRALGAVALAALVPSGLAVVLDWGMSARAAIVAALCVLLWLTEWVPVWVPTVILWVATPLLLGGAHDAFGLREVLAWSADPVLVLFLGGFALAAAIGRQGADRLLVAQTLRLSGGRALPLVALAALATAVLSMWMSNVAAAALMLGAFRPIWEHETADGTLRRALLLAVALAADVGGIATPIGSGPNGIAMAAVAREHPIDFVQWMTFGVPLAVGLLAAALALVALRLRPTGTITLPEQAPMPPGRRLASLGLVFAVVILLWLTEPLHGMPAWAVALGAVPALLVARLLGWRDLLRLDWATIVLIAGGIALGALLDRSGLVRVLAAWLPLDDVPPVVRLLLLCLACALLSALMSNTGTASFLIPLAATVDPSPSTAIIVAVSASLGVPFVISTPPNAMAVAGGLRSTDLLGPGLLLMIGGCVLVAFTGPWVLRLVGIP